MDKNKLDDIIHFLTFILSTTTLDECFIPSGRLFHASHPNTSVEFCLWIVENRGLLSLNRSPELIFCLLDAKSTPILFDTLAWPLPLPFKIKDLQPSTSYSESEAFNPFSLSLAYMLHFRFNLKICKTILLGILQKYTVYFTSK